MSYKQQLIAHPELSRRNGLNATELREFVSKLSAPPDPEFADLLTFSTGFEGPGIGLIDFTGRSFRFEFEELAPAGIPIAQTVEGNFWVLDNPSDPQGVVFFFSHDPPVVVKQFSSLESFIDAAVLRGAEVPDESDSLAENVWSDSSSGFPVVDARGSADRLISDFARELPDSFRIFDLREQSAKGFAWGRGAANLACRRCGSELVFAVEVAKPKRGLFARLLERV